VWCWCVVLCVCVYIYIYIYIYIYTHTHTHIFPLFSIVIFVEFEFRYVMWCVRPYALAMCSSVSYWFTNFVDVSSTLFASCCLRTFTHTNYYYVQPPMSHRIDLISILNDCCCVYCGLLHVVLVLGVWCLLRSARFLNYKKQIMSKKQQWNWRTNSTLNYTHQVHMEAHIKNTWHSGFQTPQISQQKRKVETYICTEHQTSTSQDDIFLFCTFIS
jgi:hypothetical protein